MGGRSGVPVAAEDNLRLSCAAARAVGDLPLDGERGEPVREALHGFGLQIRCMSIDGSED